MIYRLINIFYENFFILVMVKIRILEIKEKMLEYVKNVLSVGVSILIVYGRRRE